MPAPRFLIDENLSIELPEIARALGFEAIHVNHMGLRTKGDPIIMAKILDENWTLVTNNWREFLARYESRAPIHAGLVLLTAAGGLSLQKIAFRFALDFILRDQIDLINKAIRVERDGDSLVIQTFDWPS